MRKTISLLCCLAMFFGCSEPENKIIVIPAPEQVENTFPYYKLKVNQTEINSWGNTNGILNTADISIYGDVFTMHFAHGIGYNSLDQNQLRISFDTNGNFVSGEQVSTSAQYGGTFRYSNFPDFPAHYFEVNILELDEANKRIKFNFSGKLYLIANNINSEPLSLSGEVNTNYTGDTATPYHILFSGIDQYCTAKINQSDWTARYEKVASTFSSHDPYKIQIHFAPNTVPGSYNFNEGSTDNYIRFFKFNTNTMTYDTYNTSGVVAHSYREFHGDTMYSYIGTFSFTAVNSNNPSDIVTVTDGVFRSFQNN